MDSFSFKEVNFQKNKNSEIREGQFLDICIYNYYENEVASLIDSISDNLSLEEFNYRITILELKKAKKPIHFSEFVPNHPQVKIFLPAGDTSLEKAINLYIKESKANYILMLSGEFKSLDINIKAIGKDFQSDKSLFGLIPKIVRNDKIVKSVYSLKVFKKKIFLSYDDFEADRLTIKPYKMNIFFDRNKYLAVKKTDFCWESFFLSNLDLGYQIYSEGYQLKTADEFVVKNDIKNSDSYLTDFISVYSSLRFALMCFKVKNFKHISLVVNLLSLFFSSLLTLNLKWVKRLKDWISFRKYLKNRFLSELDILKMFE